MKTNSLTPKPMTKSKAIIIVDYLNLKLSDLIDGLNYWQRESNKIDNSEIRVKECIKNILHLQSAFEEIHSMFINLKTDYQI